MDIRPGTALEGPDGAEITIDREVGQGGFGQVFLGHLPDGTEVAVKTVPTALLDENALKAFQNEINLSVGIAHPNVVKVLHVNDGTKDPGRPPYLVMEYVANGNLRNLIDARKSAKQPFAPDELRGLYLQVADGMAAINEKVVHRDLKPENVLLDANGLLKVADFGVQRHSRGGVHVPTKRPRRSTAARIRSRWMCTPAVSSSLSWPRSSGRWCRSRATAVRWRGETLSSWYRRRTSEHNGPTCRRTSRR
jgi:serine/threonine protein kinase